MVLSTKVVSDVREGCAACLGHSVVDDNGVISVGQQRKLSSPIFTVALL